jgi:hypothetical protein
VDESDSAQVQAGRISQCRIAAMALQTLVHHPQENTQRRIERAIVALQAAAQTPSPSLSTFSPFLARTARQPAWMLGSSPKVICSAILFSL